MKFEKKKKKKMNKVLHSNESLENIRMYCSSLNQTDNFIISINDEIISLPIEVAVSISSKITKSLIQDPSIRKMHFDIEFRDENSLNIIKNIIEGEKLNQENLETNSFILDFCDFCLLIENSFYIQQYIDRLYEDDDISTLSKSKFLQFLNIKQNFSIFSKNLDFPFYLTNEINFIANNFMDFIANDDFLKWAKEINNISMLELILNSEFLLLDEEDSLLSFILKLVETNNIFAILFHYLYIEYCSESSIKKLMSTVIESNLLESISQLSLFKCFSRGISKFVSTYKLSNNDFQRYNSKRYKIKKVSIPYDQNNPLKGILNYANDNNNLLMEASSIDEPDDVNYGDVYSLIHMKNGTSFVTKNETKSFIEASMKDNSTFVINNYLIRGNDSDFNELQAWVLEGKRSDSNKWELLDSHNNEIIKKYESKMFSIQNPFPVQKVRLMQKGLNASGCAYLYINGFEIYGEILINNTL